jgi:hypothetical protein
MARKWATVIGHRLTPVTASTTGPLIASLQREFGHGQATQLRQRRDHDLMILALRRTRDGDRTDAADSFDMRRKPAAVAGLVARRLTHHQFERPAFLLDLDTAW